MLREGVFELSICCALHAELLSVLRPPAGTLGTTPSGRLSGADPPSCSATAGTRPCGLFRPSKPESLELLLEFLVLRVETPSWMGSTEQLWGPSGRLRELSSGGCRSLLSLLLQSALPLSDRAWPGSEEASFASALPARSMSAFQGWAKCQSDAIEDGILKHPYFPSRLC